MLLRRRTAALRSRCRPTRHFFFSSRRRHTRFSRDWSSDVCSSDLAELLRDRVERRTPPAALDVGHRDRDPPGRPAVEPDEDPDRIVARRLESYVEIGRASCRERAWLQVVAAALKEERRRTDERTRH